MQQQQKKREDKNIDSEEIDWRSQSPNNPFCDFGLLRFSKS